MSCWCVLELSDERRVDAIPQLLIKPRFGSETYTVFLTDLSNIWSEELDLSGIVARAAEVESPIEVSERDTAQLAILLENVQKSLEQNEDTSCSLTRAESEGVVLNTTISLPEPLDLLTWKFTLRKRTAITLKDELILPLLVSSHIQHKRISSLLSIVSEKDRAVTRLVDQYESSNLDLAAAFPSISNVKSGKRLVKREQSARHVPGLQTFHSDSWRAETADLIDTDMSTLGLFQEALSECTPNIPPKLKSEDEGMSWWSHLDTSTNMPKRASKAKAETQPQSRKPAAPVRPTKSNSETDDDETEDEFETHENFKSRELSKNGPMPVTGHNTISDTARQDTGLDGTTDDEDIGGGEENDDDDDDDLDAPPKSQSLSRRAPPKAKSATPEPIPPKANLLRSPVDSPPQKPKARGFKIGGKSKKTESPPVGSQEEISKALEIGDEIPTQAKATEHGSGTKSVKKGFKIGGRSKTAAATSSTGEATTSTLTSRERPAVPHTPSAEASLPELPRAERQPTPIEEEREETAEEKAERKRRELKRKNEELARKQAQSKKKKRF